MVFPKVVIWLEYGKFIKSLNACNCLKCVNEVPPHACYISGLDVAPDAPVLVAEWLNCEKTCKCATFELNYALAIGSCSFGVNRNRTLESFESEVLTLLNLLKYRNFLLFACLASHKQALLTNFSHKTNERNFSEFFFA